MTERARTIPSTSTATSFCLNWSMSTPSHRVIGAGMLAFDQRYPRGNVMDMHARRTSDLRHRDAGATIRRTVRASIAKEVGYIHPHYRALIAASPFAVLATCGPGRHGCLAARRSRGLHPARGEKTLLVPDRRGNNRIDSMRNILHESLRRAALPDPGCGETLRVNGRAYISTAPQAASNASSWVTSCRAR